MKTKKKLLAILHFVVLIGVIYWNYYSNTGLISGATVGDISAKYDSLFTPAGYTFAIWGVIYLGLIYFGVYMLYCAFKQDQEDDFVLVAAPWVTAAHALNGIWLWFWLHEEIGIAAIIISVIFLCLLFAVFKLKMEKWDAPVSFMAGVWWPIDIYVGWLAVACIANVASYLNSIDWAIGLSEIGWTVTMLIVAALVNLIMVLFRNMREFALVGIWAFIGISVRHWGSIPEIQFTALACAIFLFIVINVHAYKNRATLPYLRNKLKSNNGPI